MSTYDLNLKDYKGSYQLEVDGRGLITFDDSDMQSIIEQYEELQ